MRGYSFPLVVQSRFDMVMLESVFMGLCTEYRPETVHRMLSTVSSVTKRLEHSAVTQMLAPLVAGKYIPLSFAHLVHESQNVRCCGA
jgi:hypothetical protein